MPIKDPVLPKNWGLVDGNPFTFGSPNNNLNTGQLALLAAAEEAYSQAASVLQPAIKSITSGKAIMTERLQTGLHLLEEAMKRHNAYMESLK